MTNWKNVLVYADGRPESSLAIAEALRLAEHSAGEVTALDVLHYLPARVPSGLLAMELAELLNLMQEQRLEQLLDETGGFRQRGKVDVQVAHGNPAFELIRRAVRGKHDLIVKTARGRDIKHMTNFGSTALHLVRKSPAPVLLVSPNPSPARGAKDSLRPGAGRNGCTPRPQPPPVGVEPATSGSLRRGNPCRARRRPAAYQRLSRVLDERPF